VRLTGSLGLVEKKESLHAAGINSSVCSSKPTTFIYKLLLHIKKFHRNSVDINLYCHDGSVVGT